MTRAEAFERYWTETERPDRPRSETLPPPAAVAGLVATATLLHDHAETIPAMDLGLGWQRLAIGLEGMSRVARQGDPIFGDPDPGDPDPHLNGSRIGSGNLTVLRPRVGGWTIRVAAAAVAAIVALAMVSLRARPGSALYPVRLTAENVALAVSPHDGTLHLRIAEARLDDLLVSLRRDRTPAAPGLARSLVTNRAAAVRQRVDVGDLDRRVALDVPPALDGVPSSIAFAVRKILGSLLPDERSQGRAGPLPPESPSKGAPGESQGPGGGDDEDSEESESDHEGPGHQEESDHEAEESDDDRDRHDHESEEEKPEREHSEQDEGSEGDHESGD